MRFSTDKQADTASGWPVRISSPLPRKLIEAMAGSTSRLGRTAMHPVGAALCLAVGYMVLCGVYIFFSGRLAAEQAWSVEQLRSFELEKGLTFVLATGVGYFAFAAFLLQRIATQQQHLAMIFQGVSDCLFLLDGKDRDNYRFLCVNEAFLKLTGLTREQVVGQRIEEVLPLTSAAQVRTICRESVRERKSVSWEGRADYPLGHIVGEVTLTPLADKSGGVRQLAGIIHDVTARRQIEDEVRRLSGHLMRARDEERRRIGRELHDSTAQELVAVALNLDLVQQRNAGRDIVTANLVADSQAIIEASQRELRTLAYQLHPPALEELGLVGAVEEYAAGFAKRSDIQVTLDVSPDLGRLPAESERALFRVVQESLGNIHRHAASPSATIRIVRQGEDLLLEVSDRGHGILRPTDGGAPNMGVGLAGMRERVRQLGGRFEIASNDQGTTVRVMVPLETAVAA